MVTYARNFKASTLQLELDFSWKAEIQVPVEITKKPRTRWDTKSFLANEGLTRETELELVTAYQQGDLDAGQILVIGNQKMVTGMAKRYVQYGCPLEDLVAEANLGLCEAMEKFDASKGARLATYANWWIKQYLRKALTENCRTIRIPVCQQQAVRAIHATAAKLTEITGQYPSDEEIAEETGISLAKVQNLRNLTVPMLSFNAPVGSQNGDEMRTYEDILSDQTGAGESPLEALSRKNGGETLNALIEKRLNAKEKKVVRLRFGIETGTTQTLEEVGNFLGLTRERIRQIQEQALKKLRRTLDAEKKQEATLLSV